MSHTVLTPRETGGLGAIELHHPPGTFAPSPATRVTLRAVAQAGEELAGRGLDWGCGVGVLSIGAARLSRVEAVVGLDLSETNVMAARENAALNGVADVTDFVVADSYQPRDPEAQSVVEALYGAADFLIANPPASVTSDGFDFRRRVMGEGADMLRNGAPVLVQALSAYGPRRVEELQDSGYRYDGIALRTELVALDVGTLRMDTYLREEREGGRPYEFFVGDAPRGPVGAGEAVAAHDAGEPVWGRWQVHRFQRVS